jgi:hypothetical protein
MIMIFAARGYCEQPLLKRPFPPVKPSPDSGRRSLEEFLGVVQNSALGSPTLQTALYTVLNPTRVFEGYGSLSRRLEIHT